MDNVILKESGLPWGAPAFDQIKDEDFMPAFRQAISEAKAEIDAITSCPEEPDYANTIEALEFSGSALDKVSGLFFNLLEADSSERRQQIAEEVSPMLTEYEMYVSLNGDLFRRVDAVWQQKDSLDLPGTPSACWSRPGRTSCAEVPGCKGKTRKPTPPSTKSCPCWSSASAATFWLQPMLMSCT